MRMRDDFERQADFTAVVLCIVIVCFLMSASPLTTARDCENAGERINQARAGALATPGEGTRPTGTRALHARG